MTISLPRLSDLVPSPMMVLRSEVASDVFQQKMQVASPGFQLRPKQEEAVRFLDRRGGTGLLAMEMRTGKTRTALAYLHGKVDRILIILPPIAFGVWTDEIDLFAEYSDYTVLPLTGDRSIAERAKVLRYYTNTRGTGAPDKLIVLVNFEAYWQDPLRSALMAWEPQAIVIDEAHKINNRSSKQAKFAHTLADKPWAKYRLALTGTPFTHGYDTAWSLFRFVDPDLFGRNYAVFERKYLKMGGFQGREVVGYFDEPELQRIIASATFRARTAECFTIPTPQHIPYSVLLDADTSTTYRSMKKDSLALISSSIGQQPVKVLARNTLVQMLRLQQITSGFALDESVQGAQPVLVDISSDKLRACAALMDAVIGAGEQVVVFCRFLRDVQRVLEAACKLSRPDGKSATVAELTGSTPTSERAAVQAGFRAKAYDVLVAQIQVAAVAIDLSTASTAIFFSVGFSLDTFQQARARLQGPTQTRSAGYYYLLGKTDDSKTTVDHLVYKALDKRIALAGVIMRDPESVIQRIFS